jgi:hypothetical protein
MAVPDDEDFVPVEALKQGRKIIGWKFKVVDNRPTSVSKGAVRLPDTAAERPAGLRESGLGLLTQFLDLSGCRQLCTC